MKRLTTFLMALLLTWIGANAQTVIHECEAEFGDWSIEGNSSGLFQRNTWSTEADASGMVTPFIEYWIGAGSDLTAATISHTQLQNLSAGYYSVSIFARAFDEAGDNATTVAEDIAEGFLFFTANDEKIDLTTGTHGLFSTNSREVYGTYVIIAEVGQDGTLDIGFTISGDSDDGVNKEYCDWLAFKNLEVTYLGETPVGYVAHECEAYGDDWGKPAHWTADNDATTNLHVNKHSTEADPSGMVTPFVEYWYASGTNLPDDVLRHDQLTGLYPGYYEVSIEVRAFNESGTTAINEGVTTFNAVSGDNSASADITALTSTTEFSSHYELYGTLYLIATVGDAGTLDIDFTVQNANYNWLSFKNLKVEYDGDDMPTLEYVTGDMNSAVETAMKAAVDAYNTSKSSADYTVALAAIEEAEASVAYYAPIVAAVDALDDAGAAVWATSDYATMLTNRTLTDEDVSEALTAAQAAQTTEGTDWSYVLKNTGEWKHDTASNVGNFQVCPSLTTAYEAWTGSTFGGSIDDPSLPLYKEIADLPAGEYTISFYAYARYTETDGAVALAFANEAEQEVPSDNELVWSDATLYTFSCTVGVDGVLDFGLKSQGVGDWFVAEEYSLTLVALAELSDTESEYKKGDAIEVDGETYYVQCDNMVENHSFELGFTGWTGANDFATEITASNFELRSDGAQDGEVYLVGTVNGGSNAASSLGKAWSIESGKTYYFSYYVKNLDGTEETEYLKTSLTNTPGDETEELGYPETVDSDWQKVEYVFDNESYAYVQVKFRWLESHWAFDNFQLYEIDEELLPIEWEMTTAGWGTMILPFDATLAEGLTAYSCDGTTTDDETETTTVDLTEVGQSITANTPYIIKCTDDNAIKAHSFSGTPTNSVETYTAGIITGTLVDLAIAQGAALNIDGTNYVLQNHTEVEDGEEEAEGLAFYPITSASEGVELDAYHCYLTISSTISPDALRLPGMATAIEAVESDLIANDAIYDLSGRRVSKAVKGVYIQNGKKVLVK